MMQIVVVDGQKNVCIRQQNEPVFEDIVTFLNKKNTDAAVKVELEMFFCWVKAVSFRWILVTGPLPVLSFDY